MRERVLCASEELLDRCFLPRSRPPRSVKVKSDELLRVRDSKQDSKLLASVGVDVVRTAFDLEGDKVGGDDAGRSEL